MPARKSITMNFGQGRRQYLSHSQGGRSWADSVRTCCGILLWQQQKQLTCRVKKMEGVKEVSGIQSNCYSGTGAWLEPLHPISEFVSSSFINGKIMDHKNRSLI